ncbi:WD and tetratricopeptide repeats protein 1 isoform X2 [Bemisia tabaci]|uniref:WD and tetratricopeptide repeats protein 1 isoform X2 n=1 Tax=Bemisia tabaci TaxID=7038 RepID=UPI003B2868CA
MESARRIVRSRLHVTDKFIERLGLEEELKGHEGCVNCLEWNTTGELLASASDDVHIILWCPFRKKKLKSITTRHIGNIFSVKFLPSGRDNIIISGSGDHQVHVHDIEANETLNICSCSTGRVKRIATHYLHPHLYWAAAEDGAIRQYDTRVPHSCSGNTKNVLVYLKKHLNDFAEAKCLALNPCRPEMLAVGANDPFVRLYDRRMINLTHVKNRNLESTSSLFNNSFLTVADELSQEDNLPPNCVQYFTAGHLNRRTMDLKSVRSFSTTYLIFSENGEDLLVNLGGEHIYLFNMAQRRVADSFHLPTSTESFYKFSTGCSSSFNGGLNGQSNSHNENIKEIYDEKPQESLPENIEGLRSSANSLFKSEQFTGAIRLYNLAISQYPDCALLYGNRAAAYLNRDWDGDTYAALRDCYMTLKLDPNHVKAFFRLARCLYRLNWLKEAKRCLEEFKAKFPSHGSTHATQALEKDIKDALKEPKGEKDSDDPNKNNKVPNWYGLCSQQEWEWRQKAFDYEKRYLGHCNTATDIKEANFFGSDGQYIVAGSDDGALYVWDRQTENNVKILKGDSSIVNCLQPHPFLCLLATSGIEPVVRLWSPQPEDGKVDSREETDFEKAAHKNQRRMKTDPFDIVLMNWGIRSVEQEENVVRIRMTDRDNHTHTCRPS